MWTLPILILAATFVLAVPIGLYMARVFDVGASRFPVAGLMDSNKGPSVCVLQPWLPDQVPGLMSRSPRACKGSVVCIFGFQSFAVQTRGGILTCAGRQR
jgi:hypothetical protein